MIRIKGAPHVFFTLSAADLEWLDLHHHMLQEVPTPPGDKVKEFWYRYEWQECGSGHVHGFLWVEGAPNVDDIDWSVLKGDGPVSEEQQQRMDVFVNYWKNHISALNPLPREDKNVPLVGLHPCNKDRAQMKNTKEELAELLNGVEHHTKCSPSYCQVRRKVPGEQEPQLLYRFNYPMTCRAEAGISHDSKKRVRFEPARNDPLLNTYNPAMILAWRAKVDVKPVMSTDAAINYVAKYASKAEQQAPAFP
ncbi:hypothetical protein C8R45DRAFT_1105214 [Mycena sanguinolenta]|nr:hypothetical protein C8R45DRAFT_1105214 [Mycena sanguinolenta]